jgi:hypothetical protein
VERAIASGVEVGAAHTGVTVSLPHRPGAAARLFRAVAATGVSVGAIAQHATGATATVVFTVPGTRGAEVTRGLAGYEAVVEPLAEVTLTGAGLRTDAGTAVVFGEALAMAGVPLTLVSLENHRLSVFCPAALAPAAVHALCEAFEVAPVRRGATVEATPVELGSSPCSGSPSSARESPASPPPPRSPAPASVATSTSRPPRSARSAPASSWHPTPPGC